ncbi:NRDE family protein [Flavobacterium sp. Fl-77]|uniref:NRDE family protein n=1 Tax=Flavobacterium flavipigmentatum TaxID=2893884 RepID=A0AAJ2SBD3_9FLAO|nr:MULTISPECIES: NRDE family protein [unclassified Flavobacterium]MDX6182083.1 NRDE family protein [Flavobacterium sp. Fl-33]MDX6186004.1 NRDE family protein [Flavobacterium sp. Fl-77]UFH39179.1 NRDE family protein [Flavobacterium sp. F-70]
MCTVSFINTGQEIIITSNRDEKVLRPSAIPPRNYVKNGKNIIFPKDKKAGGTWFAVDAEGTILVLLNGALEKHEVQLPYRKSRGLIVLDMISHESPKEFWKEIDLQNIEPFTLVLYQNKKLHELIWNGISKQTNLLEVTKNHIWSSVTLYPEAIRKERKNWFYDFLEMKKEISALEMLNFHRYTEENNSENGLVINRNNQMKTLSITQTTIRKNKGVIGYHDLQSHEEFYTSFISI